MTMKLSEKGLGKLYNSKACYYDPDTEEEVVALSYFEHVFEFEPDDFVDCVVLSVEEAKEIAFKLNELSEGYFLSTGNIDSRSVEWSIVLNELIEQAEVAKIGEDYNKALNRVAEELKRQADIDICRGMDLDTTYSDMLKKKIKEVAEND